MCTSIVNKVINVIFADNDSAKEDNESNEESDEDGLFKDNIEKSSKGTMEIDFVKSCWMKTVVKKMLLIIMLAVAIMEKQAKKVIYIWMKLLELFIEVVQG